MLVLWSLLVADPVAMTRDKFPFVADTKIKEYLACPSPSEVSGISYFKSSTRRIDFPEDGTLDDLVILAHECDQFLFSSQDFLLLADYSPISAALAGFATDPTATTVSTLLALNLLESSIRISAGYNAGKAPLLKNMIHEMTNSPSSCLAPVCRLLLLPKSGLNLRNLLWHGFVTLLPRPWLALVLVLNHQLEQEFRQNGENDEALRDLPDIFDLQKDPQVAQILEDYSFNITRESEAIRMWLPESHRQMYTLAATWIQTKQRPATCCAMLSILMEHGLRLDWCMANQREDDRIACPAKFFVTLDGHGQRHVHDLLLHPFLMADSDDREGNTNALIAQGKLPASTTALLTDLFCSSCGGPNIRATIAHGTWDAHLCMEWTVGPSSTQTSPDRDSRLWDMVSILQIALASVALKQPIPSYRPRFSYTTTTQRAIQASRQSLEDLKALQVSDLALKFLKTAKSNFGDHPIELKHLYIEHLGTPSHLLLQPPTEDASVWSSEDIYVEHDLNQQLAQTGITRSLLHDISYATYRAIKLLEESLRHLDEEPDAHKRRRKSWLRRVHSSQMAYRIYSFAYHVALLSIEQKTKSTSGDASSSVDTATLQKAVHRSRMVVSTVDNFLQDKVDRATKSAVEFAKGKAVRAILNDSKNL